MMQRQLFLVDGFSWSPPGAERCSAPSWTSGVRTPELAACQSSQAQAARLAWARRPRRLTPLPWPSPRGLRERVPPRCAWQRARRGSGVPRPLRPERHAHSRVRDDGVTVLQIEPIRARLRQLRVVVQELEQDDDEVVTPRPDPQHSGHEQNKSANLCKEDA